VLGAFVCLTACTTSANIDEIWIRGHFRIPEGAKLLKRVSSPENGGAFGRENLLVQAEFEFTEDQYKAFMQRQSVETTWSKLPIAETLYLQLEEIDRFRRVDFKKFDAIPNGYYVCETASQMGILSERKEAPTVFFRFPMNNPDKDYVLGVLDRDKKILYVILQQDY
jgi:hypothetical protein